MHKVLDKGVILVYSIHMKKCVSCGDEFEEISLRNVYCSGRCRVRKSVSRYRCRHPEWKDRLKKGFVSKEEYVSVYGCGCKKEDKVVLCKKHGRY